jgi:hypothetical protein
MKINFLIFLFIFFFGIPFLVFAQCDVANKPPPPDCPSKFFTETVTRKITQYNCTKGACGGVIEFNEGKGEKICIRYCSGENCNKKEEEYKKPKEYQRAGFWSDLSYFEIASGKYEGKRVEEGFGTCKPFVTCERCDFPDIPKIFSNIISCLLWTVSPIAMVFLLLYTGIMIYFSFGSPEVIERAKSIWKAIGIGWFFMLFAWTIVNFIGKTFKMPGW